jgi:CheY-like chemotaxis protein
MPREILLVDDDPDIREALTELLEDEGYAVKTAANGVEAMEYLRSPDNAPPALILLDLMMPTMNGPEFLDHFEADHRLPAVPIVVLSANVAFGGPRRGHSVLLYLNKPVDYTNLIATVDMWCA